MPALPASRPTVSVDVALYNALRDRAAESGSSVADIVDEAVRALLAEDADDRATLDDRAGEPTVPFEALVQDLKGRGRI